MNNRVSFFRELKRRNVYKVAVAYAVVGWLVMQVAATIVPALHLPDSLTTAVVVITLLGFPLALVIAWAFEMTPEGMKPTENLAPDEHIPQWSQRKFFAFVGLVALLAAALFVWQGLEFRKLKPGATAAKSIAMLSFENLSRDPDNAFFADGIQDETLTRLAKIGELKVISRTSTQRYKNAPEDLPRIAQLSGAEQAALSARSTENAEAYEACLRGLTLWNGLTNSPRVLEKNVLYFNRAVQLDPNFGLAWASLSAVHSFIYAEYGSEPRFEKLIRP
jgi:hypothetical protein